MDSIPRSPWGEGYVLDYDYNSFPIGQTGNTDSVVLQAAGPDHITGYNNESWGGDDAVLLLCKKKDGARNCPLNGTFLKP
jgi:hypothetical protein